MNNCSIEHVHNSLIECVNDTTWNEKRTRPLTLARSRVEFEWHPYNF